MLDMDLELLKGDTMKQFLLGVTLTAALFFGPSATFAQDYGGHARHSHRDWSNSGGRGHVHNACWSKKHGRMVWVCR
jgi:hypothetical protein